jgi:hypothetical protein
MRRFAEKQRNRRMSIQCTWLGRKSLKQPRKICHSVIGTALVCFFTKQGSGMTTSNSSNCNDHCISLETSEERSNASTLVQVLNLHNITISTVWVLNEDIATLLQFYSIVKYLIYLSLPHRKILSRTQYLVIDDKAEEIFLVTNKRIANELQQRLIYSVVLVVIVVVAHASLSHF